MGRAFPCSAWRLFEHVLPYLGLGGAVVDGVGWRLYFMREPENFSCVNGFDIYLVPLRPPNYFLLPCACAHIKWRHKGGRGVSSIHT